MEQIWEDVIKLISQYDFVMCCPCPAISSHIFVKKNIVRNVKMLAKFILSHRFTFVSTRLTSIFRRPFSWFYHLPSNHIFASIYNCVCMVISQAERNDRDDQDDNDGDDAIGGDRERSTSAATWRFFASPAFFWHIQNSIETCLLLV